MTIRMITAAIAILLIAGCEQMTLNGKKPQIQPQPPPPPTPMLLLRELQVRDLARVAEGEPTSVLGPAELFRYGHEGIHEDIVFAIVKDGDRVHRYFNVLTTPLPEWVNRGSVWFDYAWKTIHLRWGAVVRDSLGVKARFQYYGQPFVFDWSVITPARSDSIIAVQMACLGAAQDAFADQFWVTPKSWFFPPGSKAYGDITPAEAQAWKTNVLYYAQAFRKAVAAKGGTVILNGDPDAPPPIFIENAQWTWYWGPWKSTVERWKRHPGNVLSVDAGGPYVDTLLATWLGRKAGTVCVDGSVAETQTFYDRAEASRSLMTGTTGTTH